MRTLFLVACLAVLGVVWGCSSFGSDDGAGSPTGEAGTDGGVSDAGAETSSTDGDAADAADDADGGTSPRGPECIHQGTFCDVGAVCCFQMSAQSDTCEKSPSDCTPASDGGAFVLECSDSASCPATKPHCCFIFGNAKGSTCQAASCATPNLQLCTNTSECVVGKTCSPPPSGLDAFYGECQ